MSDWAAKFEDKENHIKGTKGYLHSVIRCLKKEAEDIQGKLTFSEDRYNTLFSLFPTDFSRKHHYMYLGKMLMFVALYALMALLFPGPNNMDIRGITCLFGGMTIFVHLLHIYQSTSQMKTLWSLLKAKEKYLDDMKKLDKGNEAFLNEIKIFKEKEIKNILAWTDFYSRYNNFVSDLEETQIWNEVDLKDEYKKAKDAGVHF